MHGVMLAVVSGASCEDISTSLLNCVLGTPHPGSGTDLKTSGFFNSYVHYIGLLQQESIASILLEAL